MEFVFAVLVLMIVILVAILLRLLIVPQSSSPRQQTAYVPANSTQTVAANLTHTVPSDRTRTVAANLSNPANKTLFVNQTLIDHYGYKVYSMVYFEEAKSGNQYRASLGKEKIIGRLVPGYQGLNDLSVSPSSFLSRQHCRVFAQNNRVYVENLSKTSFTRVNGIEARNPVEIHMGDVIAMADVRLRVVYLINQM